MSSLKTFQDVFDKLPTNVQLIFARQVNSEIKDEGGCPIPERIAIGVGFSEKGFGFGEITIVADKDGQVYIDTECMSRDRIKRYLCRLVDEAITDTDKDPEKHARYCKVMNQRCGEGCSACGITNN